MPRVAVAGCGDVSIVHFEAIEAIADAELVAVCDSDPATLTETAVRGTRCRASPTITSLWTPLPPMSCTCVHHTISTPISRSTASGPELGCCSRSRWPIRRAEGDRVVRAAAEYGAKIGV